MMFQMLPFLMCVILHDCFVYIGVLCIDLILVLKVVCLSWYYDDVEWIELEVTLL